MAKGTICKGLFHHYRGFMFGLEQLIAKEKVKKVKRILYLYRVLMTGIHVLETGVIESNILKLNEHFEIGTISELIEMKQLELSALPEEKMLQCWDEIHELEASMTRAFETSMLPENPLGLQELSAWLVRVRKDQLRLS